MSIEGVGSYEDIYSDAMSQEDMMHLDFLGIEWRGRNIHEIQDDFHLKIVEIAHRALVNTALTNPDSLPKIKADLVELFQIAFAEDDDEDEDEPSSRLYRYDPISGTYQELIADQGKVKDTIKKTGKAIKKAGKKAGKAIEKGAKKVKDGAKKAYKKTTEWVKEHPVEAGAILTAAAVVAFGPAGLAVAPAAAIPPSNDDPKRTDGDEKPKASSLSSNTPPPPNPSTSASSSSTFIPHPSPLPDLTGHQFTYPNPTYTSPGSFNPNPGHVTTNHIPQLHTYVPSTITSPTYHPSLSNLPPTHAHYSSIESKHSAITPVFETSHSTLGPSNVDIYRPPIIESLIPSGLIHSPTQYHPPSSSKKDDHFSTSDNLSEVAKMHIPPSNTAFVITEKEKPSGDYMKGFAEGAKKGAVDSVKELPANLLNIAKLAGNYALDPFIHPLDHLIPGQELVSQAMAIQETVSYLQNCDKAELFKTLAPEAAELVLNWDNLSQEERGRLSGYCVGKYGTDVLVPALGVKGAKAVANLAKGELAASPILKEAAAMAKLEKPTEAVIKEAGVLDASLEATTLAKNGVTFPKQTPVQEYLLSEGLQKDVKEILQNTKISMQSEAFAEGKALAEELQSVTGLTTQSKLDKIINLEKEISEWLGKDTRLIQNEAGDAVFLSKDGFRRVRFDFNSVHPHNNPHSHVEIKINGEWVKSGPIYPTDVPHN